MRSSKFINENVLIVAVIADYLSHLDGCLHNNQPQSFAGKQWNVFASHVCFLPTFGILFAVAIEMPLFKNLLWNDNSNPFVLTTLLLTQQYIEQEQILFIE